MRVSIALATYNGSKYLGEQLQSIAAQTLPPCEIVLCDDGSSDDTVEIARRFSRSAPFPVQVVRNDVRLNFRANFMKAAGLCAGDLIAFCDQDDRWRADKLALVTAEFTDADVLLVHHNARIFSAARGVTGCIVDERAPSTVRPPLSRTPFDMPPGFTQTFRRSLLALGGLRETTLDYWPPAAVPPAPRAHEPMAHDQWIFVLASCLGKVSYLSATLADYRQHDANLYGMESGQPSRRERFMRRLKEYSDYAHLELAFARIAQVMAAVPSYPVGEDLARRAVEAAAVYAAISQAYAERNAAYGAASPLARAAAWMQLVRHHRYRPGPGFHFAHQGLLRDFVHGVCRAKLRHRPYGLSANDPSLRLGGPFSQGRQPH
jgi:hypothetical protein